MQVKVEELWRDTVTDVWIQEEEHGNLQFSEMKIQSVIN